METNLGVVQPLFEPSKKSAPKNTLTAKNSGLKHPEHPK